MGFNNIFKSKYASEHKSEEHGKNTCNGNNSCQIDLLCQIQDSANCKEAEALAKISEHGSEYKCIGQCHEHGRVHLIVSRKSVHLDKHFKWFKYLRVLKLCRRITKILVSLIFDHDTDLIVILSLSKKRIYILFTHPAT